MVNKRIGTPPWCKKLLTRKFKMNNYVIREVTLAALIPSQLEIETG